MSKFEITERKDGEFQFNLRAPNGEIILTSEGYTTKDNCINGIQSVKENSLVDGQYMKEISIDNQPYFNLKGTNGEIIGTSQMYKSEENREIGMDSVKKNARIAPIVDLTVKATPEHHTHSDHNKPHTAHNQPVHHNGQSAHGHFELLERKSGEFQFHLKSPYGEIILTSEVHTNKDNCLNGIHSIKKHSLVDTHYVKQVSIINQPYFNLKTPNGEIIGTSQMYKSEENREIGMVSVKKNAHVAPIVDLTAKDASAAQPHHIHDPHAHDAQHSQHLHLDNNKHVKHEHHDHAHSGHDKHAQYEHYMHANHDKHADHMREHHGHSDHKKHEHHGHADHKKHEHHGHADHKKHEHHEHHNKYPHNEHHDKHQYHSQTPHVHAQGAQTPHVHAQGAQTPHVHAQAAQKPHVHAQTHSKPHFELLERKDGEYQFNLKAPNGEIILTSQGYTTKANCKNGIDSVKKNSPVDAQYMREISSDSRAYFNLKATNGEVIGTSQMYQSEENREIGIASVKKNAPIADIVDLVPEHHNASGIKSIILPMKKKTSIWLKLLLLVLALLLAFFALKACQKVNNATSPIPIVKSQNIDRDTIQLTLPNGMTLHVFKGGIEDQMITFLQSSEYEKATSDQLKNRLFSFDNIEFKFASGHELMTGSNFQLNNVIEILKYFNKAKVKIGAYTDKIGSEEANLKLSVVRAETIKNIFAKAGITNQVVGTEGYGEKFAVHSETAPDSERALDRIISLRFVK